MAMCFYCNIFFFYLFKHSLYFLITPCIISTMAHQSFSRFFNDILHLNVKFQKLYLPDQDTSVNNS